MIDHEAKLMADPVVTLDHLRQYPQECLTILIILVDRFPPVAPRSDVIEGTGKLDSQGSRHAERLARCLECNNARPDPNPLILVILARYRTHRKARYQARG